MRFDQHFSGPRASSFLKLAPGLSNSGQIPEAEELRNARTRDSVSCVVNMAASSGGDVRHAAEVQDENLSMHFTSPPSSVIYSPALNCLIGTTKENAIEVLDIHTGLVLRHVEVPGTGKNRPQIRGICQLRKRVEEMNHHFCQIKNVI